MPLFFGDCLDRTATARAVIQRPAPGATPYSFNLLLPNVEWHEITGLAVFTLALEPTRIMATNI
jgi:hypothetical protein